MRRPVTLIHGARVAGLASGKNRDDIKELGAEQVIDSQRGDYITSLGEWMGNGVDLVFGCHGGDTLEHGKMCVGPGGRVVSTVDHDGGSGLEARIVRFDFVFVEPTSEQLDTIRGFLEAGTFRSELLSCDSRASNANEAVNGHDIVLGVIPDSIRDPVFQ